MLVRTAISLPGRISLSCPARLVPHSLRPRLYSCTFSTMSPQQDFKQASHKLLVIPGPIECSDEVLYANAHPSMSHMSLDFVPVLGDCIRMTRDILFAKDGQPFIIAGSGTLGWDQVASNLVEAGEDVLLLNTGYFSERFVDCLEVYGAKVDQLKAPLGGVVPPSEVEKALQAKKYKILALTHVDTSTGVLTDAKGMAEIVQRVSPDTLVVIDGVCSVASEEIRMHAWGIDVVLTGSQKGLGTPPGLSIVVASQKALKVLENRKTPVTSYYASWKKWLPIMKAYESGNVAYFATPPVNLIYAYQTALKQITQGSPSLEERFQLHREASQAIKQAATDLGLKQVAVDPAAAANGMTAIYFPPGVTAADVVPRFYNNDIVVAGGIHSEIKDQYFRIGHMGVSVVDKGRHDIQDVVTNFKNIITEALASKKS